MSARLHTPDLEFGGRSFALCPWTTVRGNTATVVGITQDPTQWLDLDGFADATFCIDCAEVTSPGSVILNLESSPTLDESGFTLAAPPLSLAPSATPVALKTVSAVSATGLSRYVRWRISTTGSGLWDATIRINVGVNRTRYFAPSHVPGLAVWLRSDLGVTLSGTSITSWVDQSGIGNTASQGTATPTYNTTGGVNGLPRITTAAGSNQYMIGSFAANITTHTLFAVLGYASPSTNYSAFAGTNATTTVNSGFAQFTETTTGIIGRTASTTGSFVSAVTTDGSSLGSLGIYSTAADSNSSVDLCVNGISKATTAASFTLFGCSKYTLFTLGVPVSYNFIGDAYEFVLYNTVLSTKDRLRVHRYLGARYGITVP